MNMLTIWTYAILKCCGMRKAASNCWLIKARMNITKCYAGRWTLWVVVNITVGMYGWLQNFSRTRSLTFKIPSRIWRDSRKQKGILITLNQELYTLIFRGHLAVFLRPSKHSVQHIHIYFYLSMTTCFGLCRSSSSHHYETFKIRQNIAQL